MVDLCQDYTSIRKHAKPKSKDNLMYLLYRLVYEGMRIENSLKAGFYIWVFFFQEWIQQEGNWEITCYVFINKLLAVPWRPQGQPIGPIDGQLIGIATPTNKHAGALFISYRQSLAFEYAQNSLNLKAHIFFPSTTSQPRPSCTSVLSHTIYDSAPTE